MFKTKNCKNRTLFSPLPTTLIGAVGIVSLGLGLSACSADNATDAPSTVRSGLAIGAEVDPSGVASFQFDVERVECTPGETFDALTLTEVSPIEDMPLPTHIETDDGASFDEDSEHAFADQYFTLPAGCYDVDVQPLDADGNAVTDCSAPSRDGVVVVDGETTEILLLSQCGNNPVGGLDVISSLNHAPQIESLVFTPSKFGQVCEDIEICATASDPDGDPLEFVWEKTGGPAGAEIIASTQTDTDDGVTSCVTVESDGVGTFEYEVTVYDTIHDGSEMVRVEDYLNDLGQNVESNDSLSFPVHIGEGGDYVCQGEQPTEDAGTSTDAGGPVDTGNVSGDAGVPCTDLTTSELRQQINCMINGGDVTFTIPEGACPEELSFTSYELPNGSIHPFEDQVVFDNVTDVYGPGTYTLNIDLPATCGYQTDLYVGSVLNDLDPAHGHGARILCYDVQEDPTCATD